MVNQKIELSSLTQGLENLTTPSNVQNEQSDPSRRELPQGYQWYPGYEEPVPETWRVLQRKDVIEWVSAFNGSGNVKHFIKEVEEALRHMPNNMDRKNVIRRVIATKLTGPAKDVINTLEDIKWAEMKEILLEYFDIQEQPFQYLKNARDKLFQGGSEKVIEYSRRFLDIHHQIMRAAGRRDNSGEARTIQRYEEEASAARFLIGLRPDLHMQLASKKHASMKEALNDALNAETIAQELALRTRPRENVPQIRPSIPKRSELQTFRERVNYTSNREQADKTRQSDEPQSICSFCNMKGHTDTTCFEKQNFRVDRYSGAPPI